MNSNRILKNGGIGMINFKKSEDSIEITMKLTEFYPPKEIVALLDNCTSLIGEYNGPIAVSIDCRELKSYYSLNEKKMLVEYFQKAIAGDFVRVALIYGKQRMGLLYESLIDQFNQSKAHKMQVVFSKAYAELWLGVEIHSFNAHIQLAQESQRLYGDYYRYPLSQSSSRRDSIVGLEERLSS